MGRRGARTLGGLRREIKERRDIWRGHEANYRRNEKSQWELAEMCAARAEELEWADGRVRALIAEGAKP